MKLPANFLGRSFAVVGVAVAMYAAAALGFGWAEFKTNLSSFPASILVAILGLSFINYGLRFWRWHRYLRLMDRPLSLKSSFALYFATYTMVITPGKVGEVFKAGVLKEKFHHPLSSGLAIVLTERVYDLLGVLILGACCLPAWNRDLPLWSILPLVAVVPAGLLVLRTPWVRRRLLNRMASSPLVGRGQEGWQEGFFALERLFAPVETLRSLALTVPAWACECLGLWLACRALGLQVSVLESGFIYTAATVVGSVSFLPGGLGGTEVTLIWLLGSLAIPEPAAIAIALVVRLATLWLAVLVGLIFFLIFRRLLLGSSPDQSSVRRS